MVRVELYANEAKQVDIHIVNITEDIFYNKFDVIISNIVKNNIDVDVRRLIESRVDVEHETLSLFFLTDNEIKAHEFNLEDSADVLNVGEYVIFNKYTADAFNEKDIYGSKDFSEHDEIKVEGVSRMFKSYKKAVSRYRLDTFLITSEPIKMEISEEELNVTIEESDDLIQGV